MKFNSLVLMFVLAAAPAFSQHAFEAVALPSVLQAPPAEEFAQAHVAPQALTNVRLTNDPAASEAPAVAVDPAGNAYVTWQDTRDGNWEIYYCLVSPQGRKLTPDVRVTNTGGASLQPKIAVDAFGHSHLTWREGNEIYYCKLNGAGEVLVAPKRVTGGNSEAPDLAVEPEGTAGITWTKQNGVAHEIGFRKISPTGAFVGNEIIMDTEFVYLTRKPYIDGDGKGSFYVAYKDYTGFFLDTRLIFHRIHPDNRTQCCWAISNRSSADHPRIALVDDNYGYFFFLDRINNNWEAVHFSGTVFTEAAGNTSALDLAANDDTETQMLAVWQDDRDGAPEIYYSMVDNNAKTIPDTRISDLGANSTSPAVAILADGAGHFVWQDDRDGNWEIYFVSTATSDALPDLTPIRAGGRWRADLRFGASLLGEDYVTVTATIQNQGATSAANVKVVIEDNATGNRIAGPMIIPAILPGGSATVSAEWRKSEGSGREGLHVRVDPDDEILEENERNNSAPYYRDPVILVPGIAGSPLFESPDQEILSSERVWVNLQPGLTWVDVFATNPALYINAYYRNIVATLSKLYLTSQGYPENPYIKTGPNKDGMHAELRHLPLNVTFESLVAQLEESGFYKLAERNDLFSDPQTNLFVFLYDWRLVGDLAAAELARFVDQVKEWTDSEQVNLLCHSMGGLIAKHALASSKIVATEVANLFFFGTPHLGAPKAFYVFLTGHFIPTGPIYLFDSSIKRLFRSAPGGLQLLPSAAYPEAYAFKLGKLVVDESYIPVEPLSDAELEAILRIEDNAGAYDLARSFVYDLSQVDLNELHVINVVGHGQPTVSKVTRKLLRWVPEVSTIGDGTVPVMSARQFDSHTSRIDYIITGVEHAELPSSERAMNDIIPYHLDWYSKPPLQNPIRVIDLPLLVEVNINGGSDEALPPQHFQSGAVSTHDCLLAVVDVEGHRSGVFTNLRRISDIPGGRAEILDSLANQLVARVIVPSDGLYEVIGRAPTNSRSAYLQITRPVFRGTQSEQVTERIELTPGAHFQMAIDPWSRNQHVYFDQAGDDRLDDRVNEAPESLRFCEFTDYGNLASEDVAEMETAEPSATFALLYNYPNPFNAGTLIKYQLASPAMVRLAIFNAMGQQVNLLINDRLQSAGYYSINWNGHDQHGASLPSGAYLCRLEATSASGRFTQTRKLLLLK
ncbi:hypothetical protein EDS67_22785 [candidate division KSB1 bacterium]|nr:MAG: hypothetical protein EDS67_22785 [candidate division KSB1 bacterium]MBC6950041.1 hypothetical protein [candidate division KSB1 bacterium]MCE7945116.1 hypothetical protein [Chlorobi bacterium CHB1]